MTAPLLAIYSPAEIRDIIAQALAASHTLDHGDACWRSGNGCVCEVLLRQRVAARNVLMALDPLGWRCPMPERRWSADRELEAADLEAVKVLIAHQRRDIGSCICGWGVDTGDLGRSHSLHVWRELQRAVLPLHAARVRAAERAETAEEIAVAIDDVVADSGWYFSDIARAHATTPTGGDPDA